MSKCNKRTIKKFVCAHFSAQCDRDKSPQNLAHNGFLKNQTNMPSLFTKIIKKEIQANIVYEDDKCLAFHDIRPQAPVHILLIPKKEIPSIREIQAVDQELMGHLLIKIPEIAKKLQLSDYRLVVNVGEGAGQTVFHLHIHIIGGRPLSWPPG